MTSWDELWIKAKKPFCVLLFLATLAATVLAQSPIYGCVLLFILLAQKIVQYQVSKKYQTPFTWPYFIPMPNFFGTMGAVLPMEQSAPNRRALFDIGIAGAITGAILAVPAILYGVFNSTFAVIPTEGTHMFLNKPLILQWISRVILGSAPAGQDIVLHPVALAGWAALFINCINMIPLGHLDGGHVMHALLGKNAKFLSYLVIVCFTYLGIQFHPIWIFFLVVTVLVSFKHPDPLETTQPIGLKRLLVAIGLYLLLALCFTPIPFELKLI